MIPLQKWLQAVGIGAKNHVRILITEGKVRIDGVVVRRFAEPVHPGNEVTVEGVPVGGDAPRTVLLMNKPKKHLTKRNDEGDREGLARYLPDDQLWLFAVGRLDFNTEGALLWTNDGELARRVLHPDWSLPKHYGIKIRGHLSEDDPGLERMRQGMTIDGVTYRPAEVSLRLYRTRATWVDVTITEGKHRQLRKMCAACGYQIVKLRREAIGPIELGDLNPRCVRALTKEELAALDAAVGLT